MDLVLGDGRHHARHARRLDIAGGGRHRRRAGGVGWRCLSAFGAAVLLPALPAAMAWVGWAGLANRIMHAASNRSRAPYCAKASNIIFRPLSSREMLESDSIAEIGRRAAGTDGAVHRYRRDLRHSREHGAGISGRSLHRLFRRRVRRDLWIEGGMVNEIHRRRGGRLFQRAARAAGPC